VREQLAHTPLGQLDIKPLLVNKHEGDTHMAVQDVDARQDLPRRSGARAKTFAENQMTTPLAHKTSENTVKNRSTTHIRADEYL
jgi:hypothetical protein